MDLSLSLSQSLQSLTSNDSRLETPKPITTRQRRGSVSMLLKRQKLEEEQQFVNQLISEGKVVAQIQAGTAAGDQPSKANQGHTKHYNAPVAFHRENLRHSQRVREAIIKIWEELPKNQQRGIAQAIYCSFYEAVLKSFQPSLSPEAVSNMVLSEWEREAAECTVKDCMHEGTFADGMFELLDRWTDTDQADEYIKLAHKLYKLAKKVYAKDRKERDKEGIKPQYMLAAEAAAKKRQAQIAEEKAQKLLEETVVNTRAVPAPCPPCASPPPPGSLARSMSMCAFPRRGSQFRFGDSGGFGGSGGGEKGGEGLQPSPPTTAKGGTASRARRASRRPSTIHVPNKHNNHNTEPSGGGDGNNNDNTNNNIENGSSEIDDVPVPPATAPTASVDYLSSLPSFTFGHPANYKEPKKKEKKAQKPRNNTTTKPTSTSSRPGTASKNIPNVEKPPPLVNNTEGIKPSPPASPPTTNQSIGRRGRRGSAIASSKSKPGGALTGKNTSSKHKHSPTRTLPAIT
eukprot:TRINITY_DN46948_c0_g1_i2.p1 TRINITY_DN46948_c0_g1~~TRINITY_DN46948_c0_g1_i2.p1  ORF type:complete len:514 (-),score=75.32 TRINITY_DN46948_c0_g1_i2:152-1693(-)